ncbi:hypothetical protein PG995_007228 [Apiospora arundinis]|uniref:IMP-specific 5'-nucleotidase-domain-containing protein n=1 Tax=Apiospora arundinis TaxID=335852 RepID=A0ABR2JGY8_9PEZI
MKAVLVGVLTVLAGIAIAQEAAAVTAAAILDGAGALEPVAACPTITKSIVDPGCAQNCNNDCQLVTTVTNGCGCPASVPTATLVAPCGGECPYAGCDIIYRTRNEACGPPRPTRTSTTRKTSTASPTSSPVVTTSIIILPPRPTKTSLPCPTVIRTTQPADCTPIRCPIPGCTEHTSLVVPCGCDGPKTIIAVQGCQSTCPGGCITRTTTASELCGTSA